MIEFYFLSFNTVRCRQRVVLKEYLKISSPLYACDILQAKLISRTLCKVKIL